MENSKKKSSEGMIKTLQNLPKLIDDGEISDEQLLLDTCMNPLLLGAIDGTILSLNDALATVFGTSRKEVVGKNGWPLLELDSGERRRQVLHKMIEERKPQLLEDYERGIWWRTLYRPIFNKQGEIKKVSAVIYNVSEEKIREQEITEQNDEFWRRLIQYSNNSFFILNGKGIIRYVSESVYSMMGYHPNELLGTNIFDYFFEPDKKKANVFFEKVLSKKSIHSLSHRVISKNKKIKYMETMANNLLDNPIVKGVIFTSRDITSTHKAENETQETKKYLENIINSTSEIIFSVDKENKMSLWNERASQISGYSSASIVGKHINSIQLIQNHEQFKSYMQNCYTHQSKPYDLKIITKHGDSKLLRINGSPVKKDDGVVKGVVFSGRDITSDSQIHGHLVTGSSYLILEENNEKAVDLLNGLLLNDFYGIFITRDRSNRYFDSSLINLQVVQYTFSQKLKLQGNEKSIVSDPSTLIDIISTYFTDHNKSIALIDRLDYLIALHGFKEVMQTIYTLSSIAARNDGIILIRLNPEVISSKELAILNEELEKLPEQSIGNITIDNKLFNILQYVEKQNTDKSIVSFKTVSKQFSITKVTTAKRINALEEKDLVAIKKRGRLKTIYITDKGRRLLQRRNVV
jgi:PAS domain S-box-containing protein